MNIQRFHCNNSRVVFSLIFAAWLIIVPSFTCYGGNTQSHDVKNILEQRCIAARVILKNAMASSGAPGGLSGIYSPDGNCIAAEGDADKKNNLAITSTDPFRIGSITKSFVATVVLLLAQEKRLSLDEKVVRFLPNYPHGDKITVRHLLGHRSGIPTWDEDEEIRNSVVGHPEEKWTVERLISITARSPLLFEPGEGFAYSNIGYFLLGKIIEKASGDSVANQIRKKIAKPLGLKQTFLLEAPHFPGERIRGYEEKDGRFQDTTDHRLSDVLNYYLAYTAGGMVSTLEDLHIFAKALATGQLLSKEMHQQQMPRNGVNVPGTNIMVGMGLGLKKTGCWVSHNGAVAGYYATISYCVDNDVAIVGFFNKFSGLDVGANEADIATYTTYMKNIIQQLFPETMGMGK